MYTVGGGVYTVGGGVYTGRGRGVHCKNSISISAWSTGQK